MCYCYNNGDLGNGVNDQNEFYETNTIALHKHEILILYLKINIKNEFSIGYWKKLDFKKFDQEKIIYLKDNFSLDNCKITCIKKYKKRRY